jgi:myb proto-oncogene protein
MKDRTDNDIKNYWNMHLKKKLAKTGTSESGASGSAKMKGDGAAAPAPKGQWERRLQTDIHTARHALQEALSIDTAPPAIKPEPLPLAQLPAPAISPAMYACSIENIARLLEVWMRPRPSASRKASAESMTSVSAVSGGGEGGSGSHSGTARTLEGFTGTTEVEGAGGAGPGPSSSLPMLESWLLDDGMGHGDAGLFCVPLADPCEFF